MKSLAEVKRDMSALYDEVRAGSTDLKTASELANITGKYLKAAQIELAMEVFNAGKTDLKVISHD